jgi:hypothetical protein
MRTPVGAETSKTHTYICIQYGSKVKLDKEEIVADVLLVKVVLKVVSAVMVSSDIDA